MSIPVSGAAVKKSDQDFTVRQLNDFVGGWLVGHFKPALFASNEVEVAIKHYRPGDYEPSHHHRVATEFTVIATGRVRMNQREYSAGDIVQVDPGTSTDFEVIEATTTVVIKTPSARDDKFIDSEQARSVQDA